MSDETIELGGRAFYVPTDRSIANDLWVEAESKLAGLTDLKIDAAEDSQAFASRILAESVLSGRLLRLLGGLLFPVGVLPVDWSEELAGETTAFLSRLTRPTDKDILRSIIAAVLARFFLSGVASATISANYSRKKRARAVRARPIGEA